MNDEDDDLIDEDPVTYRSREVYDAALEECLRALRAGRYHDASVLANAARTLQGMI